MEQEQVEFTTKLNLLDAVLEIEHTGKYRIFRDDAFGKKDAQHWLEDNAVHFDINDEAETLEIVIHLENTTDYFCIDLGNECNDIIVNTMYQYFKKENTLIKFMEIMVDDICKQSQDVQNG